jgi:iron complex outermembrane receptor protein
MRRSPLFFLLLVLPVAHAWAETLPSEQDFLGEAPVVLSASRLKQSVADAPAAMTVIDRDMIKAMGVRQIHEVLRLVPGFYVSYHKGNWPVISYHGLGDALLSRIQVLIDGRSIYNPVLGGIDWADLPLSIDEVERVEVVRGPSSPSHGINAFLAVVNVITRHAALDKGTRVSVTGGPHIGDMEISHAANLNGLDYRLTLGMRSDDGITASYFNNGENRYLIKRGDTRTGYANLRADYTIDGRDSLSGQMGWSGGPRGVGNRPLDALDYDREAQYRSHYASLKWQRVFDPATELSIQYNHYYRKQADAFMSGVMVNPIALFLGPIQFPMDDSYTSKRDELEFIYSFSPLIGLRIAMGGGLRYDRVDAPMTLVRREDNHIGRLFANGEWRPNDWLTLNAGIMLEYNDFSGMRNSPRVALNLHPLENHTFRYSYSEALRSPTIFEAKADRHIAIANAAGLVVGPAWFVSHVGGDTLQPERIMSHEIGYIGNFPSVHTVVELKVFNDHIQNLIAANGTTAAYNTPAGYFDLNTIFGLPAVFRNGDWAKQWGHELSMTYRPSGTSFVTFSWSRLDMDDHDRVGKNFDDATPSVSGAPDTYRFFASHRFASGFSLSGFYQYEDELLALGDSDNKPFSRRWDVRLAKEFQAGLGMKGELAWVTQNLFNEKNYGYRGNEANYERRSYLVMELKF